MADYVRLIHRRSGGTYGWRRIRAELLDEYEMIVNRKLIRAITQAQRSRQRDGATIMDDFLTHPRAD